MRRKRSALRGEKAKTPRTGAAQSRIAESRPLNIEAAKHVLKEVLCAEVESETVPSEVLSFRMKGTW